MKERAITSEQRRWLQQEITEWQRVGLLSEDTTLQILDLYVPSAVAAEQKSAKIIYVLMAIAALLAGVAVLLLIGFNWEVLPGAVKLVTLFGVLGAVYTGGWYLRFKKQEKRLSEVAFFLGCLLYGANIWLVQQVFQVSASPNVGILCWAIGVIPFVLLIDTLLFHSLLIALLGLWTIFSGSFFGWFDNSQPSWQSLITASLVLLPVAFLGLRAGHHQQRQGLIKLYLPLLIWWVALPLWQYNGWMVLPVLGLFGAILLYINGQFPMMEAIASSYRRYGILLTGFALLPLGYHGLYSESFKAAVQTTTPYGIIMVIGFMATGILLLLLPLLRSNRLPLIHQKQAFPFSLGILFCAHTLLLLWHPKDPLTISILLSLLSNAATVWLAVWLVQRGLQEERGRTFSFGIFYLLLWICLRYADLFGEAGGMLGASLLFASCAGVLFGVAFYWRKRKGVSHV